MDASEDGLTKVDSKAKLRSTFRSPDLELDYAEIWSKTPLGTATAALPWLLVPEMVWASRAVGAQAVAELGTIIGVAIISFALLRRLELLHGFRAPLIILGLAVLQSCRGLSQPAALTVQRLAPAPAVMVLAAFFSGPGQRSAQMVVLGCGLIMAVAAFIGDGLRAWRLIVPLLSLGFLALRPRWEAELMLRRSFLEEWRLDERANHFYLLLSDMLPKHLIRRYFESCLVGGPAGIDAVSMGERPPCCGVLFFQICCFDEIFAGNNTEHAVRFLNRLFSSLDDACEEEGDAIVKVETVGGTHVSACGVFSKADSETRTADDFNDQLAALARVETADDFNDQLAALARVALRMHDVAADFKVTTRAGLHCGPVVAGIVGDKLPRFRLFGDTVNTAARFQSQCPEGGVLLSEAAATCLECSGMETSSNGLVYMKGLGEVETFLLAARTPADVDEAPTLLTNRSKKKQKSVTWHGAPLDDSDEVDQTPITQRCKSEPCIGAATEFRVENTGSDDEDGNHAQTTSVPQDSGFSPSGEVSSVHVLSTPSSKEECSSKSLTSTRFGFSRESTRQRVSVSFGLTEDFDDISTDDEDCMTRSHSRTKTPTAWLSFGSQLGQEAEDVANTDSDEGDLTKIDSDRSWRSRKRSDSGKSRNSTTADGTPGAAAIDSGSTKSSTCAPPTPRFLRSYSDLEPPGSIVLAEEVVRRIDEALREEPGLFGGLLPHFHDGAEEGAFRARQASLGLSTAGGSTPYAAAVVLLFFLPCMVGVEKLRILILAIAAFAMAATALAMRMRSETCSSSHSDVSCPGRVDQRRDDIFAMDLYSYLGAGSLSVGCALATRGCGSLPGAFLQWAWLLLALWQRPSLRVALVACAVKALLALLCGSTIYIAAPIALLVLQRADERVERRRYKISKFGDILCNLEAVAQNLMPPSIVRELRENRFGHTPTRGPRCISHRYDLLTVLQADLVGFTAFARNKMPEEVVCVVNGLFSIFDKCVEQRGVYKMETIGDAYICASGMPDYSGGMHSASAMLLLAIDFVDAVAQYKALCGLPDSLGLRVGVHSGSCVGGVVGTTMQRYHLFGRTMHVAEVLESTAQTDCVHLSQTTKEHAVTEEMGARLHFAPMCPPERLATSKGEIVPIEAIDGLATFVLRTAATQPDTGGSPNVEAEGNSHFMQPVADRAITTAATEPVFDELAARRLEQLDLAVQWHTAVARRRGTVQTEGCEEDALCSGHCKSRRSFKTVG